MAIKKTIASFAVMLSANAKQFNATMTKAAAKVGSFTKKLKNSSTAMKVGFAAAAVVAAAMFKRAMSSIVRSVTSAINRIDMLAKTARKLGTTAEGLVGLQLAGTLAGVNERTLNMGLQRMARRIAEAAKGMGEAKEAIRTLGLDAKKLSKQSLEDQFMRIAKAMGQVANEGERLRLTFKLFDSEGVALKNLFENGGRILRLAREDVTRFGLDVTTGDTLAIEHLTDATTRLKASMQGLMNVLVTTIAPALEHQIKALTEFVVWVKNRTEGYRSFSDYKRAVWVGDRFVTVAELEESRTRRMAGLDTDVSSNPIVDRLDQIVETQKQLITITQLATAPIEQIMRDGRFRALNRGFA